MLAVLCGAVFLEGIDVSMMGVALPSIRSDLDMSTSSLQWVVSAYVLGYGGFLLLGGRLEAQRIGDRSGDQRFRQSMSLAVSRKTTARASWARRWTLRRSVLRRSWPKFDSHELVRSTGQR
ncbi:MAG: MFS transporter, partial [Burkholderiales bacterium]